MCSKCYRDHVSRSLNPGRTNSCNSRFARLRCSAVRSMSIAGYYASSNTPVTSSSSSSSTATSSSQTLLPATSTSDAPQVRDDQDEVIGRMDEDNDLPTIDSTVNKMDDDNSESPLPIDEQSPATKQDNDPPLDEPSASLLNRVVSAPTMPIVISRNIDIPGKNETNISYSVMETSSLGTAPCLPHAPPCTSLVCVGADSMSPVTASSVDKKKRNRCTWPTCNKKLGLTGTHQQQLFLTIDGALSFSPPSRLRLPLRWPILSATSLCERTQLHI